MLGLIMTKNYEKRSAKEYNLFRAIFQWITCTLVYGLFYRIVFGLRVEGRENVPKKGMFIVASNHVSAIDPFLVIHAIQKNAAYMAKKELFEKPIGRFFLDLLGAFSVNREKLSVSTIKTVIALKQTNWCLGIFPQGTRERNDDMSNINKGFASFAKTLKCPILPIAICGVSKDNRKPFRSHMLIKIGKPIAYNDNVEEMVKIWGEKVSGMINEANNKIEKKKSKKEVNYAQRCAKDFNILTRLYQLYAVHILFLPFFGTFFYNFKFIRNKKLDKKLYILAPNHISYMDVFLVNHLLKRPLAYMAKQELFKTGNWKQKYITRNVLRLGAFAVNREKLALSTIRTVKEVFKAKFNLCIFPQGGIRKNKVIENINGGFIYFAKTNKIDILPAGICGLEEYNWKFFKKKNVELKIGEPISYKLPEEEILKQWSEQVCKMTGYENLVQNK